MSPPSLSSLPDDCFHHIVVHLSDPKSVSRLTKQTCNAFLSRLSPSSRASLLHAAKLDDMLRGLSIAHQKEAREEEEEEDATIELPLACTATGIAPLSLSYLLDASRSHAHLVHPPLSASDFSEGWIGPLWPLLCACSIGRRLVCTCLTVDSTFAEVALVVASDGREWDVPRALTFQLLLQNDAGVMVELDGVVQLPTPEEVGVSLPTVGGESEGGGGVRRDVEAAWGGIVIRDCHISVRNEEER